VIDEHVRLDSPSSLYSRPTSRMFREARASKTRNVASDNVPSKPPTTTRQAGRELSYDGEAQDVVGSIERYRFVKPRRSNSSQAGDNVRKLRDDHEILRQEVDALRAEFRSLQTVLLSPRGW
jgi:hypothetical protein